MRRARSGETLRTLDGADRDLVEDDLVISGPDDALGLAGIMGGESSEVSEGTTRVLVEVAHFDPVGVLLSGKRHALRSEAVSRFERGVDPLLPPIASARAAELMIEIAGAEAAPGFIDEYPTEWLPPEVLLPEGEAERLLGIPIDSSVSADYLRRLGFEVVGDGALEVKVPSFRPDVTRPADLVEEIARIHGYDRIPARLPFGRGGLVPDWLRRERRLRDLLTGAGYAEVWNFDFLDLDDLVALGLPEGDPRLATVELRNPLSEEQSRLRTTLLPGLLHGIATNQARNLSEAALFEMGTVFFRSDGELPEQPGRLAFAAVGRVAPGDLADARIRDARDASGLMAMIGRALRRDVRLEQAVSPGYHPGRAARVLLDEEEIGVVGELHPGVAERFDIVGPVAMGEIALGPLAHRVHQFAPPSVFPPVVFDLAFDLDDAVAAGRLLEVIAAAAGSLLEDLVVFDVFRGDPLAAGRKSVAVRLTFRHPERTLVDDELVPVREAITTSVDDELGGQLRGG